jgi:hypothetical protein
MNMPYAVLIFQFNFKLFKFQNMYIIMAVISV